MSEQKKLRFYGRRLGRKLRPNRLALQNELLPKLSFELSPDLDPASLFEEKQKKYGLEIGFGGGEHLAWRAQQQADIGWIGSEVFINGISSLLANIQKSGISNIRIYPRDARNLIASLKKNSLDYCFLLFPDPWPKKRHHERRFVQKENLDLLADILRLGADFTIATDDLSYLTWILHHMAKHPAFAWEAKRPADWQYREWPITRYEEKAKKVGRKGYFLYYKRV